MGPTSPCQHDHPLIMLSLLAMSCLRLNRPTRPRGSSTKTRRVGAGLISATLAGAHLRPNRSWLLTNFPGKGVFTRPRPNCDIEPICVSAGWVPFPTRRSVAKC
jgi:hypothetical protein